MQDFTVAFVLDYGFDWNVAQTARVTTIRCVFLLGALSVGQAELARIGDLNKNCFFLIFFEGRQTFTN